MTDVYTYALAQIMRGGVGEYHKDISVDESGQWLYRWEGTGALQAAEHNEFMVDPSAFVVAEA